MSNWSKSRKGDKKGRKVGLPKFKTKNKTTPRSAYTAGGFDPIEGDPKALHLPKNGRVHYMKNAAKRAGDGQALRMTISQRAGRWYAPLTAERDDASVTKKAPKDDSAGINLGVKNLATLSDGAVVPNPRYLKKPERKLKQAQQALSRKTKDSNRRAKTKTKVTRLHTRVANQRLDAIHKPTTRLAETFSDNNIEDLHATGIIKNHHLTKVYYGLRFWRAPPPTRTQDRTLGRRTARGGPLARQ